MEDDDSTLLAKSNRIYSHEIEIVSPTSMTAPQQTSQHTSVDIPPTDDSTPSHAYFYLGIIFCVSTVIGVGLGSIPSRFRNISYVANIWIIPSFVASPFTSQAHFWACQFSGFILYICLICVPTMVTCVIVLAGTVVSPIALVLLPWLVVCFIIARLLQFIRHGDAYDNLVILKFYTRTWIYYLYLYSIASALAIFLIIAHYAPGVWRYLSYSYPGLLLGNGPNRFRSMNGDWNWICNVISGMLIFSTIFLILIFKYMPRIQLDISESGINIPEAVLEIADCLNAFFGMKIMLKITTAPALKHHNILGLETWKWIQAIIFTIIVYNIITIFTHMSLWLLQRYVGHDKPDSQEDTYTRRSSILHKIFPRRYLVYWGNGMKHSINFILSSLMFLLVWVFYFRSVLNETPTASKFWEFGVWTCLSIFICALLWLIKVSVLLSWEAASIYVRLESKILQGGKQLYYLGLMGRHSYDIFNLLYRDNMPKSSEKGGLMQLISRLQHMFTFSLVINLNTHNHCKTDTKDKWESDKKLSDKKKSRAKDYLMMQGDQTPTIFGIQQAALYFFMAKSKLLEEDYTSIILKKLKSQDADNWGTEQVLKELIGEENWNNFQHQLDEYVDFSESVSFETRLKAWMEMAHNNCLFLANTLSSAKEVVDCLNNIISSVIIFGSFIAWLLLTGLATTQVLVLIAAPLLAGTFIFQNTCKTLFEGIMFAYVVHPFNVGDLCILDEKMMEVRTVGVWRTTFSKIGTQEEVIYTNSELADKSIINHKTNFDWDDSVELDVGSLGYEKIKNLKQEIEKYLDDDKDKYTPGYNSVEVSTTEDFVKLIVYFRHNVSLKNRTFLACFKEKRKLRSEFVLEAEKLADRNTGESLTQDRRADKAQDDQIIS